MASDQRPQTLPPEDLESDPEDLVLEWAESLDRFDYLTLLRLPRDREPTDNDVREAWRAFALTFHPDRHRDADANVHAAATRVFQRGVEAYRVLQDPPLRRRYLSSGALRMSHEQISAAKRGREITRAQDMVRSAVARPFAVRADELIERGDLKQARLQLQLALMREPQNELLNEKMRALEQQIAARR
jgi:curved DNA-binding protein CbpA